MIDNRTTELREKLNKLIIGIERLDIKLDSPAYGMTLGEYEQEREKLLDEFEQAIAATLGEYSYDWQALADGLNARAERTCEPTDCDSGEMDVDVYALSCGHVAYYPSVYEDTPSYCPECGAKVVDA